MLDKNFTEKPSFHAVKFLLGVHGDDEEKAKEIYEGLLEEARSESDNGSALYFLGRFCDSGIGTQEDEEKAVEYMTQAAEKGHQTAREWLGDYYKESNPELAVFWYKQSTTHDAQRQLAHMYKLGKGVPANCDKTIEILENILEDGDDSFDTYFILAFCYDEKQRYVQSFLIWKKLCERDDLTAYDQAGIQLELARHYLLGYGTDRNLDYAIYWAKKSLQNAHESSRDSIAEKAQKIINIAMETKNENAVPTSPKKSGGCYVATAVYGSYDCPEVWTLRRFRDYTLAETWYGKMFIKLYYAISPTLVKCFGKRDWFKNLWKPNLDKMVKKLNSNGIENTPYEDKTY